MTKERIDFIYRAVLIHNAIVKFYNNRKHKLTWHNKDGTRRAELIMENRNGIWCEASSKQWDKDGKLDR